MNAIYQWDLIGFRWFNAWAGWKAWADAVIIFRAEYLPYVIVVGLILFGVFTWKPRFRHLEKKNWLMIMEALIAGGIARLVLTKIIRHFYYHPRPFEVLTGVRQLIPESGASFPSGHAMFFFAIAMTVMYYYPKTGILFFLAALSMSLARVSAGVHWPSDILGGAILGIFVAIVIHWFVTRLKSLGT